MESGSEPQPIHIKAIIIKKIEMLLAKKPYLKRYWRIGTIPVVLLLLIGIMVIKNFNDRVIERERVKNKQEEKNLIEQSGIQDPQTEAERQGAHTRSLEPTSLSPCPEDFSGLFTKPIVAPGNLSYIIPLGNLSPPGHSYPTNHLYFILKKEKEENKTPLYAPGNITLTVIGDETQKYSGELAVKRGSSRQSFELRGYVCKGLFIDIGGLTALSEKLENVKTTAQKDCQSYSSENLKKAKGIDQKDSCYYTFELKVEAGELLGYTDGFEIGLFNLNKPLNYINKARYAMSANIGNSLNGICLIDLYSGDLKDEYDDLFGDLGIANKFRSVEPRCGSLMQDVAGTLQGNWFGANLPNADYESDGRFVALVHQNWDPTLGAISPGYAFMNDSIDANHALTFHPKHEGTHNREFSEVKSGPSIYCYDEDMDWEPYPYRFLIQLVDDTHIKIEKQSGKCGTDDKFINPVNYER